MRSCYCDSLKIVFETIFGNTFFSLTKVNVNVLNIYLKFNIYLKSNIHIKSKISK